MEGVGPGGEGVGRAEDDVDELVEVDARALVVGGVHRAVSGWGEPPSSGYALWLLGLFAVSIGLPFFALAANLGVVTRIQNMVAATQALTTTATTVPVKTINARCQPGLADAFAIVGHS